MYSFIILINPLFLISESLSTLKKYFFASLLFWLSDFISEYGTDNIVIKRMLNVGAKFDITLVTLKEWSKAVRDDLNRRMITEVKSLANVGKRVEELQKKVVDLYEEVKKVSGQQAVTQDRLTAMEKMMTEMHSVLMGNKTVGVPQETKDIDSSKEAKVEEEKKKPSNAFSVIMKGQKRAPSFAHFDGFKQWSVSKFFNEYIIENHNVLQKGIMDTSKKQDNSRARMIWKALLHAANEEEKKYLTFAVAVPSPSDPQYGNFQSTVSVMGSNLYATLLQSKKDEYKDITGDEVGRVKSTVSSMCRLIEKIQREANGKKKQSI